MKQLDLLYNMYQLYIFMLNLRIYHFHMIYLLNLLQWDRINLQDILLFAILIFICHKWFHLSME